MLLAKHHKSDNAGYPHVGNFAQQSESRDHRLSIIIRLLPFSDYCSSTAFLASSIAPALSVTLHRNPLKWQKFAVFTPEAFAIS